MYGCGREWGRRHQNVCGAPAGAELCALDAHGRSRFQLLQNALNKEATLLYVVFDALFVGGKDIRQKPLLERKKILKALIPSDQLLHYSEHLAEFGRVSSPRHGGRTKKV